VKISAQLLRHIVWWKLTDVSEVLTYRPDDGGSKYLRNVGKVLLDYMVQQARRQLTNHLLSKM
jgi:hypothetical protein